MRSRRSRKMRRMRRSMTDSEEECRHPPQKNGADNVEECELIKLYF